MGKVEVDIMADACVTERYPKVWVRVRYVFGSCEEG